MDVRYTPLFKQVIIQWNARVFQQTGKFPGLPACFGPYDKHPFAMDETVAANMARTIRAGIEATENAPVEDTLAPVENAAPPPAAAPATHEARKKRRGRQPLFDF